MSTREDLYLAPEVDALALAFSGVDLSLEVMDDVEPYEVLDLRKLFEYWNWRGGKDFDGDQTMFDSWYNFYRFPDDDIMDDFMRRPTKRARVEERRQAPVEDATESSPDERPIRRGGAKRTRT
ncbi:expressed unknown protein [Seminavis robusta]|uniref:Uncharacterized protein n=1 Tax=Seminavis robusta TaxID=568900 RepID=A0A9N8EMJ9_9STRA|nr:expressed unknown protein [Seminavis robusta]|eukprot:Sro1476_g275910.1 n/a (123) ;mRNA; f:9532-9900